MSNTSQIKRIKGHMFIIPGKRPMTINKQKNNELIDSLGLTSDWKLNPFDQAIAVWVGSSDEPNWAKELPHELRSIKSTFPPFLPYRKLMQIKEGEVLSLVIPIGIDLDSDDPKEVPYMVDLTCQQKGFKYSSHGDFEEVLDKVVKSMTIDAKREIFSIPAKKRRFFI